MTSTLVALLALSATPVTPMDALLTNVPGAGQISAAKVGDLGGVRMTVRRATSTSSPEALEQHFMNRFSNVGLSAAELNKGTVAGVDPTTNVVYSAMLTDNGASTEIMVASYEILIPSVAPLYPGASHVTKSFNELSFHAAATVASVESFYRDTLKHGGWSELRPMVFVKDDQLVYIDAVGIGEDTSVEIVARSVAP